MKKVIITAALTGAVTHRTHTPYVPITTDEIVAEAVRCEAAGAAIVHLHVRDASGRPVVGLCPFIELVEAVRSSTKLAICLSTSSWKSDASIVERVAATAAKPELVSFHVGSMNRGGKVFINSMEYQEALIEATLQYGVKPEFEIFDLGQLGRAKEIHDSAGYPGPFYVQFILGAQGGCPAHPRHLSHMVESLPPDSIWSVAAVGRAQLPMNLMGLILGGQVRTGLEDNVYLRYGVLAESNAVLVERLTLYARELGYDIASPEDARAMLGVPFESRK